MSTHSSKSTAEPEGAPPPSAGTGAPNADIEATPPDRSAAPRRKIIDAPFLVLCALTLGAGLAVGLSRGWDRMGEIVAGNLGFLALLLPKIAAGVFIAAALPILLPRHRVTAWIGRESGVRGLAFAMVAGAAIPGGPMMTFTLATGLMAAGADLGAAVALVTGWALFSLNRTLIWELSFLHADLVGLRVLLSLPFPILVGLAVRLAAPRLGLGRAP